MYQFNNEDKLKSTLKTFYRVVQVSWSLKEKIWFSVTEELSAETAINPGHFLLRGPVWTVTMAVIALVLITFGAIFPPG
jgi:hypothetical protein